MSAHRQLCGTMQPGVHIGINGAHNLPDVPVALGDSGLVMEFGIDHKGSGPFQRLFTIPFNPDGSVALPLDTEPARITLDNGIYKRQVELSKVGKVKELRL